MRSRYWLFIIDNVCVLVRYNNIRKRIIIQYISLTHFMQILVKITKILSIGIILAYIMFSLKAPNYKVSK